jgi:hypothetical protein
LYYYIEKAKEDNIITFNELEGFRKIMDDYRNEVSRIENVEIDPKLFKKVKKEADKEIQELIKKNLKESIIQSTLNSNVASSKKGQGRMLI